MQLRPPNPVKLTRSSLDFEGVRERVANPATYKRAAAEIRDLPRWMRFHKLLQDYTKRNGEFFFTQIGAHDGVRIDPIRRHIETGRWNGLLVEPVPHIFDRLRKNYAGYDGLSFANVAVSDTVGRAEMLVGVELAEGQNNVADIMSTLNPDVIEMYRTRIPDFDKLIQPMEVATTTLQDLFEQHGITNVDGLFVDAEGHDGLIVSQLLASDVRPSFILYEHSNLSQPEQLEIAANLTTEGYNLVSMRVDTFAHLPQA